jgi:hypothetical protein
LALARVLALAVVLLTRGLAALLRSSMLRPGVLTPSVLRTCLLGTLLLRSGLLGLAVVRLTGGLPAAMPRACVLRLRLPSTGLLLPRPEPRLRLTWLLLRIGLLWSCLPGAGLPEAPLLLALLLWVRPLGGRVLRAGVLGSLVLGAGLLWQRLLAVWLGLARRLRLRLVRCGGSRRRCRRGGLTEQRVGRPKLLSRAVYASSLPPVRCRRRLGRTSERIACQCGPGDRT